MSGVKTIPETIRRKLALAERDLALLQRLRDDHIERGLDPDDLDAKYEALADWRALMAGVSDLIDLRPDPRSTEAWRTSAEGRALERLRKNVLTSRGGRE